MAGRETAKATIRLRGYASTVADLERTYRPPRTRVTSALLVLFGSLAAAPIVFLIPPHIPWVLGAVGTGSYLAYKRWTGEYLIHGFSGICPNCGTRLTLRSNVYVRLPYTVPCYACHHEPELVAPPEGPEPPPRTVV